MSVNIRVGLNTNHLNMTVTRGTDPEFVRVLVSWTDDHGFAGQFEADSLASAFSMLAADLKGLYRNLGESCTWSSLYENNVHLEFVGDGRGHIEVMLELIPDHLLGPWVKSRISIDQTHLTEIIAASEEAARV